MKIIDGMGLILFILLIIFALMVVAPWAEKRNYENDSHRISCENLGGVMIRHGFRGNEKICLKSSVFIEITPQP